ncbi:MAG: hypothetical protein WBF17_07185, partial [Phycisphaerae bacterium]
MPAGEGLLTTIDEVSYGDDLPWPTEADGSGPSLQLVDLSKDNDRIGNWAVDNTALYTPGEANSVDAALPTLPDIRINEVQGDNVTTLADNMGDYDPWIELYDAGSANVLAVEVHQADPDGGDLAMELSLSFSQPDGSEQVTLIEGGAAWSYLDDGSDQGMAGRGTLFDDSGWDSGRARLGYGDSQITLLSYGLDPNDKYITYYFRHTFQVQDAADFTDLFLSAQRDDGIVVYLNGDEIWRDNMPTGPINYETVALSSVGGGDETAWFQPPPDPPIPVGLLVEGDNVLAVEIHQQGPSSTDIGFDLELIGERTIYGSATEVVTTDAAWSYLDDGSDQGAAWREAGFDDDAWAEGPATLGFGNGGESAVLQAGHTTYYFRHRIDMQGALPINPLLRIRSDDGAIVYLNGQEVFRVNMPAGDVDASTLALGPVEGPEEAEFAETAVEPGLFVPDTTLSDLDDCYLTDDYTDLTKWRFPAGISLEGGDYLLVWTDGEPGEQTATDLHTSFATDPLPGSLALVWLHGPVPIVVDYVDYDFTPADQSTGRWLNGEGDLYPMVGPTPGGANSGPYIGPAVISEIHYNPDDSSALEFIEVYNRSGAPLDMWETYDSRDYSWAIEGFELPVGTALAAGEALVVVPFDPLAEPDRLAAFEARYALGGSGVQIVGGYGAYLDNGGEMLRLQRPENPPAGDPDSAPYVPVDSVRYDDESPWPTEADGGGLSLHRVSSSLWGSEAGSWEALPPTPGEFGLMANIVDVSPDPRNAPVTEIEIVFSEPVTGFDIGDLSLTRDAGADLLTTQPLTTTDNVVWTLAGLAALTTPDGAYVLRLTEAASGIVDGGGNPLYRDAEDAWVTDTASPTADVIDVSPDPRDTAVERIDIVFDEPVTGLDVGDLDLTRDGGADLLTGGEGLNTVDGITWRLTGLTALTDVVGTYAMALTLTAAGSGIEDAAGNPLACDASDAWLSDIPDRDPPTAQIVAVSPDPRSVPVEQIDIVFSEPVSGFDIADLGLTRDAGADLLTTQPLTTGDGITWTLGGLGALTAPAGDYV